MVTRMIGIILLVEIVTSLLIIPFSRMVCIIILLVISSSTLLENSFATIELFENSIVHIIPEYLALYIVGEFVRNHRIVWEFDSSHNSWIPGIVCMQTYKTMWVFPMKERKNHAAIVIDRRWAKHHHNAINVYTHYKFQETTSDTNDRFWIHHFLVFVCAHQIRSG